MEIDWSKAPEGATHYAELAESHANAFYKFVDGVLFAQVVDAFFDRWVASTRPP